MRHLKHLTAIELALKLSLMDQQQKTHFPAYSDYEDTLEDIVGFTTSLTMELKFTRFLHELS